MKNEYSVKEKLTLAMLAMGVCCFGFILPDSLSNHYQLVHFSAHFGMSFLIALCLYIFCTIKMRISKLYTYAILISSTLFIGVFYKIWEIATEGELGIIPLNTIIDKNGIITSMSQNLSGLMAAMFLIESLLAKNLVMNLTRSGNAFPEDFQTGNR